MLLAKKKDADDKLDIVEEMPLLLLLPTFRRGFEGLSKWKQMPHKSFVVEALTGGAVTQFLYPRLIREGLCYLRWESLGGWTLRPNSRSVLPLEVEFSDRYISKEKKVQSINQFADVVLRHSALSQITTFSRKISGGCQCREGPKMITQ